MKESSTSGSGKSGLGWVIFAAGFIAALVAGWVVFPTVLYSQRTQPINFSHVAHQDSSCEDCHFFGPDGSYSGIPRIDKCKECHESQLGQTEDERILVEDYLQKEREIAWYIYAWQPDNVYFSHAPHKAKNVECATCHKNVNNQGKLPPFVENRWTGYSKETMKMDVCEKCHADHNASNSCQICHK